MKLENVKIGFCMTGSFCTFEKVFKEIEVLVAEGANVVPIISQIVDTCDNRFFSAEQTKGLLKKITGNEVISSVYAAEPIGPKKLLDIVVVAPCTGNTLAKLANGITDTAVTMAVKAHLRNNRPVVLGVSTNDGLGAAAKNIGELLNAKNYYFIPFCQDDPINKEKSLVFKEEFIIETVCEALLGKQLQPILKSS